MEDRKILYTCIAYKWFDKINGNTYHSVRITRHSDNKTIVHPLTYGYGEHYRQTAIETMVKNGWIPEKYNNTLYLFERENNYPILWHVFEGLKRDCVSNGKL